MSEYTVTLKWLLKQGYQLALDKYPIFSEEYRDILNQKIINHFWFREIGQETPDRFNFMLMRKMNEIMPYFNKMYESELIKFDPLATEFFSEGRDRSSNRDYASHSRNKGKEGQTVGEVFTSNEDTIGHTDFGETSTENNVGDYKKQGDKTSDTTNKKIEDFEGTKISTTTEDFDEATTGKQIDDFNEETTGKKTEDFKENTSAESTTSTDMHTHEVGSTTHTATTNKSGSQDTVFSDIPQTGITTTTKTDPDGTVTRTTTGYATTTTGVTTAETTKLTENTNTDTQTDNTGTVKVDSSGKRTNDNTTNTTGSKTNDNTTTTEGTKTNDNTTNYDEKHTDDNVTDFTENVKEQWHESGYHTEDTDFKHNSTTDTTGNTKVDTERNTSTNTHNSSHHAEESKTGEQVSERFTGKGRRGASPSELIMKYRDSLINIDMMVIDSLEPLFMQLF